MKKYFYKDLLLMSYYGAYRAYIKTPGKCFLLSIGHKTKKAALQAGKVQIDYLNKN